MYKVIKFFTDLQDNNNAYRVGDTFPRQGVEVSPERLKELSTTANKRGIPVIEEIPDEVEVIVEEAPKKPKRTPKKKG